MSNLAMASATELLANLCKKSRRGGVIFKAATTFGLLTLATTTLEPNDGFFETPFIQSIRQALNAAVTADGDNIQGMIDDIRSQETEDEP